MATNSSYTQGYSNRTLATHLARTAESDAGFLLPFIKKNDRILDVGCGPGTITTGFAKYANEGSVIGIDISAVVIQKAKDLVTGTPGSVSVVFEKGNILKKLAYADGSFDVVFASQVFGHMTTPEMALTALAEMRRLLKPGGILATRDGMEQHFFPRSLDLGRLWVKNQLLAIHKGAPIQDPIGTIMPTLLRKAGFDADDGKVRIGASTTVFTGKETREWLGSRATGQLSEGDPYRQSWLDAGITKAEIEETVVAIRAWVGTEDAWFVQLQCEMLAWK